MTDNQTTGAKPVSPNRSYGPPRAEPGGVAPARPGLSAPTATYPGAPSPAAPASTPAPAGPQVSSSSAAAGTPVAGPPPRPTSPVPTGRPTSGGQGRTRRAYLRLARIDPWTVMKVSFVLSIALAIVTVVAIAIVWVVLDALGVFSSLNNTIGDISGSSTNGGGSTFSLSSYLSFGHVMGYTLLLALVDIVLVTAISTLSAYLYNIATRFVGGLELTLTDDH